jgi:hypothetical protein
MGREHANTFHSLRDEVLSRLVAIRASIDRGYAQIPDDVVREQFDTVLSKMASYLETDDPGPYRGFVQRWGAMREGEGFGTENVIHSLVAIGDVVRRVAQKHLEMTPETADFNRAVTGACTVAARVLVDGLADQLEQRSGQLSDSRDR